MGTKNQDQFLNNMKRVAYYGLKRTGKGFAAALLEELKNFRRDAAFIPVHPSAEWIGDLPAVRSAVEISPAADSAIIILSTEKTPKALEDVALAGIKHVWLVLEAFNDDTEQLALEHNMEPVSGCPLLFMPKIGFPHNVHRYLAKLFKKI
ncbi:CoA-binding protein [bacterium]|nr:CoA-binding protein [bacterium]